MKKILTRVLVVSVLATVVILLSACAQGSPNADAKEYRDVGVAYQVVFGDNYTCPANFMGRTFYTQWPPTLELQNGVGGGYWTITIPQYWRAEHGGGYSEGLGLKTIGDARCQVTIRNIKTTIKVPAQ